MTLDLVMALTIFGLTFVTMVFRPKVPSGLARFFGPRITVGQATTAGAVLTVLTGLVGFEDFLAVLRIVAMPIAVLLGLSILALCAGQSGFFEWAALKVARTSSGNSRLLLTRIFVLSSVFTVLFPNDATVLTFTPLIILMLRNIRTEEWDESSSLPFLMAVIFGCNAASIALITSNPINLIAGSHFGITFLGYAKWMLLPGLVSALTCLGFLHLALGKSLPATYRNSGLASPESAIVDKSLFNFSIAVITSVMLAFFLLPLLGIPFYVAIFVGAPLLLVAVGVSKKASVVKVVKGNPWDEIVFVVGLFMVVFGLKNVGLTEVLGQVMKTAAGADPFQAILSTLGITFLGTSLTNDWPMIMISSLSIEAIDTLPAAYKSLLPFAAVMGTDLGAKIVPSASLATLIWMGVIRKMTGDGVSWWQFIKIGLIITPPTLLAAALALCLEAYLFL